MTNNATSITPKVKEYFRTRVYVCWYHEIIRMSLVFVGKYIAESDFEKKMKHVEIQFVNFE